ncbi:MAG: DNA-binding transcriptional ArsR family regulator [Paracoccaceae bacterium]|jgi:DNA-binding transcriptional ArsR family regulator
MTYQSSRAEEALAALADPTRRAILGRLRSGPLPVGRLAEGLPVSRPAVSQHLKILSDAGLLLVTPEGTRRLYSLSPHGLDDMRHYLDTLWTDALSAFADEAKRRAENAAHEGEQ